MTTSHTIDADILPDRSEPRLSLRLPGTPPFERNDASFRDPSGFVFHFQNRVFRAIDQKLYDLLTNARDDGTLPSLIDDGLLVPTEIIPQGPLLDQLRTAIPSHHDFLEHEPIDPITYPCEWTPSMLADAGKLTIDLQLRLIERGLSLKDATAYNIQFRGAKPVFIDIPSIERPKRRDIWIALGQFQRMFVTPLLMNARKGRSLRSYFLTHLDGCDIREARQSFGTLELLSPRLLLDVSLPYWLSRRESKSDNLLSADRPDAGPNAQILNLRRLRAKLDALSQKSTTASQWSNYAETCHYAERAESAKRDAVAQFLRQYTPDRVLDIGCNTGAYSRLATECQCHVIAVDADAECVDQLYRQCRDADATHRILPMCVDLTNPSPSIGFRNRERPGFLGRVRGDCVMALALIHHLYVRGAAPLDGIRDLFWDMTDAFLILEHVGPDDPMYKSLTRYREDAFEPLTLKRCRDVFAERFELLQTVSLPPSTRTLLFWRKR